MPFLLSSTVVIFNHHQAEWTRTPGSQRTRGSPSMPPTSRSVSRGMLSSALTMTHALSARSAAVRHHIAELDENVLSLTMRVNVRLQCSDLLKTYIL